MNWRKPKPKKCVLSGMPGAYYAALGRRNTEEEKVMCRSGYWEKRVRLQKEAIAAKLHEELKARRLELIKEKCRDR